MELGVLEQKLRAVPGVLDCSVSNEGVAVVVHPEVDPRVIELRAQVLLAEAGDRRPLLVVGGMTTGPRVLPSGRPAATAGRPGRRRGPTPLSPAAFALLVLALLAVVPIAGREAGSRRAPPPPEAAERAEPRHALGRLPVADEVEPTAPVVETVPPVTAPPLPSPAPVVAAVVRPAELVAAVAPVVTAEASERQAERKDHKAKGKAKVRPGRGPAVDPPGHADPPGRRRGHFR